MRREVLSSLCHQASESRVFVKIDQGQETSQVHTPSVAIPHPPPAVGSWPGKEVPHNTKGVLNCGPRNCSSAEMYVSPGTTMRISAQAGPAPAINYNTLTMTFKECSKRKITALSPKAASQSHISRLKLWLRRGTKDRSALMQVGIGLGWGGQNHAIMSVTLKR